MAIEQIQRTTNNHYSWGNGCSGWHLVQSPSLSVIEELMPPDTGETRHRHKVAQQFFRILSGTATFEIGNEIVVVERGSGLHIPPNTPHRIRNDQTEDLEFLVISEPTTRGDRYEEVD